MYKKITFIIALLLVVSCSSATFQNSQSQFVEPISLTNEAMQLRSNLIKNVVYNLVFHLDNPVDSNVFSGRAEVTFNIQNTNHDITFDFNDGKILKLFVNGKEKTSPNYNNKTLTISAIDLHKGSNNVIINFLHSYSQKDSGLLKYTDTEDGKTYVYTDLNPVYVKNVFPCFDQPNIKASIKISVAAPSDWLVVSAMPEEIVSLPNKNSRFWVFKEVSKISLHTFSLAAGPFKMWKNKLGDVPVRLFARQSQSTQIDPSDWFLLAKQGVGFFETYFEQKYPYEKYDHILVPQLRTSSQQNTSIVMYNDSQLFSKIASNNTLRKELNNTILNEMAHMWVGNKVALSSWKDLWFLEGMSSYSASMAQNQIQGLTSPILTPDNSSSPAQAHSISPTAQTPTSSKITQTFFSHLKSLTNKKDSDFRNKVAYTSTPGACTNESLTSFDNFISQNPNLPNVMMQNLKMAREENKKCVMGK